MPGGRATRPESTRLPSGVQAHRSVVDLAVVEQRYLVHAFLEQAPPVLADPALRVALASPDRLGRAGQREHRAIRLLELPGPDHPRVASLGICTERQ